MKKISFVLFVFVAACSSERVEVVRERVGCEIDAQCNDRDVATADWCEIDSGVCNHERVVEHVTGCESSADCDDNDRTTTDACEEGTCVLTRETVVEVEVPVEVPVETPAPYDPRAYQDLVSYCPAPIACERSAGPSAWIHYSACGGSREPWRESGYKMFISLNPFPEGLERLHIRPQLSAGDPDDVFRVTVETDQNADGWPDTAVFVGELTPAELAADGLTVPVATPEWEESTFSITFEFVDHTGYKSRSLQWAIPAGGITNAATSESLAPCPLVGPYTDVPEHGLLWLDEGPGGEPRCEGTVRGTEEWSAGFDLPSGLFRSESDSRLYYATDLAIPRRLMRFETLKEFVDWFRFPSGYQGPDALCAQAAVFSDAALLRALDEFEQETVGTRPGTPVTWFDYERGEQRYGFADRQWTLLDIGTSPVIGVGIQCSSYAFVGGMRAADVFDCWLDLTGLSPRYRVESVDPATVNPTELDEESGWLLWYNQELPTP